MTAKKKTFVLCFVELCTYIKGTARKNWSPWIEKKKEQHFTRATANCIISTGYIHEGNYC